MHFTDITQQMTTWFIGMTGAFVFALMITYRTQGDSQLRLRMRLITILLGFSYASLGVTLLFTRDVELYRYFVILSGFLFHTIVFIFDLLFWEVAVQIGGAARRLYQAFIAGLTVAAFIWTSIFIWDTIELEDGVLDFEIRSIGIWFSVVILIPCILTGLFFIWQSLYATSLYARLRSLIIGMTFASVPGALAGQYMYDFFRNNQVTGPLDTSVVAVYIAFLTGNIATVLLTRDKSPHSKQSKAIRKK